MARAFQVTLGKPPYTVLNLSFFSREELLSVIYTHHGKYLGGLQVKMIFFLEVRK